MKTFKNIIFDFGGIIVDLNRQAAIDAFKELGFNAENDIGYYVQSGIFTGLESGLTSKEDFYAFIRKESGRDISDDIIRNAWNRMLTGIPLHRIQAIKTLREKYRVYMLSNTNCIHWEYSCRELFPQKEWRPEDCFDRIFLSFEMHLMKPDKRTFRHVLQECDLQAEETLFIDDSAANCASAQESGLQVFHSEHSEDWLKIIK